jgi:hypothetical protein
MQKADYFAKFDKTTVSPHERRGVSSFPQESMPHFGPML